ncbi:tyrosine-type recombinase/integrase [Paenibacillus sp. CN-4]|uniref:tyrosine-type recombinase/integrase n=1 Tax=Paenibacillus nanchangensis TaxID=3348343 RepID=UPI00397D70B5
MSNWWEHISGNNYRLRTRDPNKLGNPKVSTKVEVPSEIAKNEKKKLVWLAVEAQKFEDSVIAGDVVAPNKTTFRAFVPLWVKGYAKQELGEYTLYKTMPIVQGRLMRAFGDVRMDKITTLHLVNFFSELKHSKTGEELATNSKLNIYKAADSIFSAAAKWGVIKQNPMEGVKRPSQSKKERKQIRSRKKHFSWAEVEKLLTALYDLPTRWRLYFTGCMLGGFRRGELMAVEWPDISQERQAIWIEKQITLNEKGAIVEGEVKTESSEGWVGMPGWYMEELRKYEKEWRKEKLQCKKWEGGDKQYLFHRGNGQPYYPNTPTLTWSRFLKKHDLPHVKLHGLRHTAGMLLRESGADIKTIQERLRHSKIDMSAEYTHESDIINREVVDKLEALNPKSSNFAPKSAPTR